MGSHISHFYGEPVGALINTPDILVSRIGGPFSALVSPLKVKNPMDCKKGDPKKLAGWWFGTSLFCHILGIDIPGDFHIFQRA